MGSRVATETSQARGVATLGGKSGERLASSCKAVSRRSEMLWDALKIGQQSGRVCVCQLRLGASITTLFIYL